MLYHKRCNLKTKEVSLGGDRKANLPNFGNSLQMWKSFIVLIHNFSLVNRIVEEIWTEWSIIITSSEKNIGQHFEMTPRKVEMERKDYVRGYLIIIGTCATNQTSGLHIQRSRTNPHTSSFFLTHRYNFCFIWTEYYIPVSAACVKVFE